MFTIRFRLSAVVRKERIEGREEFRVTSVPGPWIYSRRRYRTAEAASQAIRDKYRKKSAAYEIDAVPFTVPEPEQAERQPSGFMEAGKLYLAMPFKLSQFWIELAVLNRQPSA